MIQQGREINPEGAFMSRVCALVLLMILGGGFAGDLRADEVGSEEKLTDASKTVIPKRDISEVPLEDLLAVDMTEGTEGSFGHRLIRYGVDPWIHAYAVNLLRKDTGNPASFDSFYFNVFVGANIRDRFIPEIQLEYEHGGSEIQVRYAQVDWKILQEHLILRTGKFLVPMGVFNAFLYPEYISKLPDRPYVLREIVPVSWAEVGAQVRGSFSWGEGRSFGYAVYVVNGLEQADDPTTAGVEDGGAIRSMRGNNQDLNDGNKAVGARFGIQPYQGITLGASVYTGAYTADGQQRLTIGNIDAEVKVAGLTFQSEWIAAVQSVAAGSVLWKSGFYTLMSYHFLDHWEPVAQFDLLNLDGPEGNDRRRITGGVNFYPYPEEVPSVVVKGSYAKNWSGDWNDAGHSVVFQFGLGF